jgi:hypothetical protein
VITSVVIGAPPIPSGLAAASTTVFAVGSRPPRTGAAFDASGVEAILGQRAIPGLLDRLIARQAWGGQLTEQQVAPDRPTICTTWCRATPAPTVASTGWCARAQLAVLAEQPSGPDRGGCGTRGRGDRGGARRPELLSDTGRCLRNRS